MDKNKAILNPEAVRKIKAFVFDVDGVLTDGSIYAVEGDLLRCYDAKDCFALRMASMKDYFLGIITGGISMTIPERFVRCGFVREDVYLRSRNKVEQMDDFCLRHGITPEQVIYCGDDVPDIDLIRMCGIGACPADAVQEVRMAADYVSPYGGGKGFVRNLIEDVMRSHGTWTLDVNMYKERF